MRLRERELFLELPDPNAIEDVVANVWADHVRCRPGVAMVCLAQKRKAVNAIQLPDSVSDRLRPDFGTIVSSSDSNYSIGQRVALRPYVGIHVRRLTFDSGSPDLMGTDDWRMRPGWLSLVADEVDQGGLLCSHVRHSQTGFITSVSEQSNWKTGSRVLFSRRNKLGLYGVDTRQSVHERHEGRILLPEDAIVAELVSGAPDIYDVRFVGCQDPLSDLICLVERNGEWEPGPGWIEAAELDLSTNILHKHNSHRPFQCPAYRITRSQFSGMKPGMIAYVNPLAHPPLRFGIGGMSQERFLRAKDVWMVKA